MSLDLEGIWLPVTVPFRRDTGGVDRPAFARNLTRWATHPIRGFVVGGSTGEAPLLDEPELRLLVEAAAGLRAAEGLSVGILAGTGAESTRATVRLSREAAAAGADGILVRPPCYYRSRMTPEALREHFLKVASASPVPLVLYHVPKFVPVELAAELVAELADHPNVAGIKDSAGDIMRLGELTAACEARCAVLVGAGTHLYSGLELGARGGVLAVALLAPADACELQRLYDAGRSAAAGAIQERLGPLHERVVGKHGVPGVKHALDRLGYVGGAPRPPLRPPDEAERREIDDALRRAGLETPALDRRA